jgi:hypothetical protein
VLKVDKLMQLIGIVLLYLVGLNGSEYILGKKRAFTVFRVRQRGGVCQMRGSMEGWKKKPPSNRRT